MALQKTLVRQRLGVPFDQDQGDPSEEDPWGSLGSSEGDRKKRSHNRWLDRDCWVSPLSSQILGPQLTGRLQYVDPSPSSTRTEPGRDREAL